MGAVLNPVGVAIAAGLGAAFGELTGYLAGFSGQGIVERAKFYTTLEDLTDRFGGWLIMFLAFIPNPLFDLAGAVAGATGFPVLSFLLWTSIGKILKMLIFALAGAAWLDLLIDFFRQLIPQLG
jgi:membrane protein YqaA with SNARE-associated domain